MQFNTTKSGEFPTNQTQSLTIFPSVTQTLIPSFKIYENKNLKFKLQYPQQWDVNESEKNIDSNGIKYVEDIVTFNNYYFDVSVDSYQESLNDFESRVKQSQKISSENDLVSVTNNFSDITIDGIPAKKLVSNTQMHLAGKGIAQDPAPMTSITIFVIKDGKRYFISKSNLKTSDSETFDKIVNSFKFI
jgi:hypothetical protein